MDFTGCGNAPNMSHPRVLQLIMDSLRYWVTEMHVDGFRFDLASTLARELHSSQPAGRVLRHHPPGPGALAGQADRRALGRRPRRLPGRQLPGPLDRVERQVPRLRPALLEGRRRHRSTSSPPGFSGSSDLYQDDGRKPYASINFITCHDGFTLHDLVSYNEKHNEANGEDNRDGANDNRSWNCGVEGPTDDPAIIALRERQKRNLIATLLLSQGVPMICGGDELSHTQDGNNNAYCQDNEITWLDWDLDERQQEVPRLRPQGHPHPARASRSSSGGSSSRAGRSAAGHQGHLLARARRARR